MNLPPFPDDYIPTSPEARRRLIAWGMDCAKMGAEAERLSFYPVQVSGEPATVRDKEDAERWRYWRERPSLRLNRFCGLWRITTADALLTDWYPTPEAAIDAARADEGMGNGDPQG